MSTEMYIFIFFTCASAAGTNPISRRTIQIRSNLILILGSSARAVDHLSGFCSRMLSMFDNYLAIDEYVIDPRRRPVGIFISGLVLNCVVIKNDHIGPETVLDQSARGQTQPRRGP